MTEVPLCKTHSSAGGQGSWRGEESCRVGSPCRGACREPCQLAAQGQAGGALLAPALLHGQHALHCTQGSVSVLAGNKAGSV